MRQNSLGLEIAAFERKAKKIWLGIGLAGIAVIYIAFWYWYSPWYGFYFIQHLSWEFALFAGAWVFLSIHKYSMTVTSRQFSRINAVRSGYDGEMKALDVFSRLEDFTRFQQLLIPNERSRTQTTEADILLVGNGALFVVEVKNNSGEIFMVSKDKEWSVKNTKNPSAKPKTMRNAINQVLYQKRMLINAIKDRSNDFIPVYALVYFTSENVSLLRHKDDPPLAPVFRNPVEYMLNEIRRLDGENKPFQNRDAVIDLIQSIDNEGAAAYRPYNSSAAEGNPLGISGNTDILDELFADQDPISGATRSGSITDQIMGTGIFVHNRNNRYLEDAQNNNGGF